MNFAMRFILAQRDPEPMGKTEVSVKTLNNQTSLNLDLPIQLEVVDKPDDKHEDELCKQQCLINALLDPEPTEKTEVSEEILPETIKKTLFWKRAHHCVGLRKVEVVKEVAELTLPPSATVSSIELFHSRRLTWNNLTSQMSAVCVDVTVNIHPSVIINIKSMVLAQVKISVCVL